MVGKVKKWEVFHVKEVTQPRGRQLLDEKLDEGWEPFAVADIIEYGYPVVWLCRSKEDHERYKHSGG